MHISKKILKKILNRNLLEDLRMSLLNFSNVMIYIIRKMSVLLENHLNYLKNNIFESFFKEYNKLLFFKKIIL